MGQNPEFESNSKLARYLEYVEGRENLDLVAFSAVTTMMEFPDQKEVILNLVQSKIPSFHKTSPQSLSWTLEDLKEFCQAINYRYYSTNEMPTSELNRLEACSKIISILQDWEGKVLIKPQLLLSSR